MYETGMERRRTVMFSDILWIFFDMGSTLVDEQQAFRHRVRDAIQGTDIGEEQFYQTMISYYQQNKKGDKEAFAFYNLAKPGWHPEDEVLYAGVKECLNRLKGRHRLGIIANQLPGTVSRLEQWGILQDFALIVTSDREGVAKPDPRIFKAALQRANCPAERCVMIGDRLDNDIAPAKKLGFKTVWVKQGLSAYTSPTSPWEQADVVVDRLEQVAALFGV